MAKPAGPLCNLACRYCFYLDKTKLFPAGKNCRMPPAVLESFIRQYCAAWPGPEINFAWQGGEPVLAGLDFFRAAVALQRQYAGGKIVRNALQTNGTLLDDTWGGFLAAHQFLVGVSVDGPPKLHNTWRVDQGGGGTYDRVARGVRLLQQHGVEFNTLTVVSRANAGRPLEVYHFLKNLGARFMQFIPLVERVTAGGALAAPGEAGTVSAASVPPKAYGEFLRAIFDEWRRGDAGKIFVQLFDVTLGNWLGAGSALCVFAPECGAALALEHNGDVFSCDHFVYPSHRLGNLLATPLPALAASGFQQNFGAAKSAALPRQCRECDVLFLCHGGCPKHRFTRAADGEPGLNYLCPAFKNFFHHSAPAMRQLRARLAR
ncbi:MAG: anaerobic sulfatase maturase [Verrucomicrobiales bacterium]|nr:anaerobic sulfatase maturase [Verrucomicrobiales bacterium]